MISRKSMTSIVVGFVSAITLGTAPIASADSNQVISQSRDKGLMVAEAHQHGEGKGSGGKHGEGNCCGGMMGDMEGMMQHGHSYAHMIASHADALKLSDAQLGKIVRLHFKHAQEHQQFKQRIHKSMMEFHQESMKPSTDDVTLRKLGKDHAEAFNAMIEQHIRDRNAVHAILSADQRNQLKTMKMDHGMHGGGHGQN
ncbi:MAG: Spy/CpxP family protein refolding chaperone [Pseudomonadota bacterium]